MLSEVLEESEDFRLNSEFFRQEYLKAKTKLLNLNSSYLKNLVSFNGRYKQPIYDENSTLRVLNSQHIRDYYINYEGARRGFGEIVPKEAILVNATGVGTLGRVNINYLDDNFSIDSHINVLVSNSKINPYYLMIFLKSYYGQLQINRYYRGSSGQIEIYPKDFDNFIIPLLPHSFQQKIENLVKEAYDKLKTSKKLYKQAENLLLEELGLKDFKPSEENIAIKFFKESFLSTGRLDAEYYQPKYEEIIEKIKSYEGGWKKLRDIVIEYSTGYPFKSSTFTDEGIYLIRINNIAKGELDLSSAVKIPFKDKNLSPKDVVKENDILISMSGTIGISCKILKDIEAVVNQRILKISIKNFSADVLPLIINSIIGKYQIERIGTGGVQTNISANDILNIIIPNLNNSIQTQIENLIKTSFKLKEESKNLIDLAIEMVEREIERRKK